MPASACEAAGPRERGRPALRAGVVVEDDPGRAGEFYAHSHYAVECMAVKYGESAMLTFVRLRLREDRSWDDAARSAFGRSFAAVDRSCTAWLRQQS